MKKGLVVSIVLAAVVVFALGSVSTVSAYYGAPVNNDSVNDYGFGGRGVRMGGYGTGTLDGFLHDEMVQVFSDKLGISVADLEARLASGETMSSIALSQGLTLDEYNTLMDGVRESALDQAVADGLLTQTQADAMNETGPMMSFGDTGYGGGMNTARGARGAGVGTGVCLTQ